MVRGNRLKWKRHSCLCHPDRSEAQWRDLQFSGLLVEMFFTLCPDRPPGSVEKHFQEKPAELQIPPLRYAPVGMTKGRASLPLNVV